jgi:hypothetical protein
VYKRFGGFFTSIFRFRNKPSLNAVTAEPVCPYFPVSTLFNFYHDDGGDVILRNVDGLLTDYDFPKDGTMHNHLTENLKYSNFVWRFFKECMKLGDVGGQDFLILSETLTDCSVFLADFWRALFIDPKDGGEIIHRNFS